MSVARLPQGGALDTTFTDENEPQPEMAQDKAVSVVSSRGILCARLSKNGVECSTDRKRLAVRDETA